MKASADKLTGKQESAITALLSHATLAGAAKACRVSETTLWRWQQEEAFQEAFQAARHQAVENAVGLLQKATGAATATILSIMQDTATPATVRLNAAGKVLDYALQAYEKEAVMLRIENLERSLEEQAAYMGAKVS